MMNTRQTTQIRPILFLSTLIWQTNPAKTVIGGAGGGDDDDKIKSRLTKKATV